MSTDFASYNNYYNHMNTVIQDIQNFSRQNSYLRQKSTDASEFYKTFQRSSGGVKAPESMEDIFREAAEIYDVPSSLLKAIGKAESGFNASAVSPAGAQGVMQLMPETARSLGVSDPFDARSNIMGGAKYISQKLKQYNGNVDLALAAYNAGSGNVAKYGGVPPFKETQNYIKKVKSYMNENITADQMVYSDNDNSQSGTKIGASALFQAEDAFFCVEMMRLQMQSRIAMAARSLLFEEEV